jgi:excinuclease ABC subunit C
LKTESEALYLEDNLIKKHQPPFNNMLKWSNSYAYIKITNEDFPQIIVTRNKIKDWSKYIWPKHNTRELKNFLQYLRYILKWRWCKKTELKKWKLCSDYHFWLCKWRCSAQQFPNPEKAKKEYSDIVFLIEQFFRWNTKPVEKEIKNQIKIATKQQYFERAAKLRDIYLQIENLVEKQTVVLPKNIVWYICQIREISGWLVYVVLNFYEWKLIDVIVNKKNLEDFDENSVLSSLESELWNLTKQEFHWIDFYYTEKIKLNKTQISDINVLIDGFFDSYLVW